MLRMLEKENIKVFRSVFSREEIENIVIYIKDFFEIKDDKIDLNDLVTNHEKLNGALIEDRSLEYEGIIKKKEDLFEIRYNPTISSRARQRFTIAHEIGHLFLHMRYMTEDWKKLDNAEYNEIIFARFGSNDTEKEANHFAGALLMPANLFKKLFFEHYNPSYPNNIDISILANYFEVSNSAALTRGRILGLIEW